MSEQVKRYHAPGLDCMYRDDKDAPRELIPMVLATDYDALHAEAEALRVVLHEIASVNPSQRGIEWAKSYASDGLKGAGSELYARWLDTFKEADALRADSQHWKGMHASSMALRMSAEFECDELRAELDRLQASADFNDDLPA